ncbi:MAG: hypothetical protein JSS69_01570 [Acidobacteria bacterium]|nr:hypothetical protein [Acidobacteriota bacterium]MBS1864581.1 hypothetical protein [Acidobacteriota bacterium]
MTEDPDFKSGGDPFGDSSGEQPAAPEPVHLPSAPLQPMPKLWVGYLLALATFIGEMIAVARHPEILNPPDPGKDAVFSVPPLEIFLPVFVSYVYWLVCVYRYHKILAAVPRYKHPISPAKAVGFHFIPLFWVIWLFIWPKKIADFVNARFKNPLMRGWVFGVGFMGAMLCQVFLDPGLGIALLFVSTSYVGGFLARALSIPGDSPPGISP